MVLVIGQYLFSERRRKGLRSLEENLIKLNPAYFFDSRSCVESSDRFLSRSVYVFWRKKTAICILRRKWCLKYSCKLFLRGKGLKETPSELMFLLLTAVKSNCFSLATKT